MHHCYLKLRDRMDSFSAGEKRVAEYILSDPEKVLHLSIDALAKTCSTSKATVVRLCKALDCSGYKEFLRDLNAELLSADIGDYVYQDLVPGQDLQSIAKMVAENNIRSIRNTVATLDYHEFRRAVTALENAARIDFYGVGCSSLLAMDAQNKFLRIHKYAFAQADVHMQLIASAGLEKGDVAVCISNSGETKDVIDILESAKQSGAVTISITKPGKNTLSQKADIALFASSDEGVVRIGAMSSRIGILSVIDMLYSAIASESFTQVKENLDKTMTVVIRSKKK